jgi:transposase
MIEVQRLFSLPKELEIINIDVINDALVLQAVSTQVYSPCPLCGVFASRIHSRYTRLLADLPCSGLRVCLMVQVRKFFCEVKTCARKIFTERLAPFIEPWARVTTRLFQSAQAIGLATGGMLGARLADRLGIHTSWMTLLRRIMALASEPVKQVSELGIDDFSFRRGKKFGTILVDMQSHKVIDLLPDRKAETAAAWMKAHPEIELVSRDRGTDYATAARTGAAQATQVADRFHIMKNLAEAVEKALLRCWPEVRQAERQEATHQTSQENHLLPSVEEWRPPPTPSSQKAQEMRRAERMDCYQQILELHEKGMSVPKIAQQVGKGVRTVRRWLANGSIPQGQHRRKKHSRFETYAPYVLERWKHGYRNGQRLWQEIKSQGYQGSTRQLYHFLKALRCEQVAMESETTPDSPKKKVSAREAVWLFVRDPADLDDDERQSLAALGQASSTASTLYQLVQEFRHMLHHREGEKLDGWLAKVKESRMDELLSFASGIEKDKAAVVAGLTLPQNNGLVEGKVNKLKLIKRMMYGRAEFPLLRQRVLHAL